jgi:thiamine-monophosphate kinase
MSFTPISAVGEFGLIDKLKALVDVSARGLVKGIGDDAAVYRVDGKKLQLVSTDLLIEQVHFDLMTTPLEHLGFKALAVNVSDICAMNALPRFATVAIALPGKLSVEMVERIYKGISDAAKKFGVAIIGGDTSASTSGLVLSITIFGEQDEKKIAYRNGAKTGDLVCVTGDLGRAFAGLKILMREKNMMLEHRKPDGSIDKDAYDPDMTPYEPLISKHLLPRPRVDLIRVFAEAGVVPSAMIDISDGLASELKHICTQSGTGARIDEDKIIITPEARSAAEEFEDDVINYALFGGEDYELLFTMNEKDFAKLPNAIATVIGRITPKDEGVMLADIYGETFDLAAMRGFQHFEIDESGNRVEYNENGDRVNVRPADETDEDIWGEKA